VTIRAASLAAVLLMIVSACSAVSRPAMAEWTPTWETARAILPDLAEGEPDDATCSTALVQLREVAPDLRPTPDDSIDATVDRWLLIAEETMFECPAVTGDFNSFESAYAELDLLADQIDVVVYGS
jgi:hypothetical protein